MDHRFQKVFSLLTPGWSDGYSFIPVGFNLLSSILAEGLDVIGMVKQLKQHYIYRGQSYTLPELRKFVRFEGARNIFGSLCATTKKGISVKIVFV